MHICIQAYSKLCMNLPATHVQITGAVLRDSSGCDALADQVLSSLQSRYSDAIDTSVEVNEVSQICFFLSQVSSFILGTLSFLN